MGVLPVDQRGLPIACFACLQEKGIALASNRCRLEAEHAPQSEGPIADVSLRCEHQHIFAKKISVSPRASLVIVGCDNVVVRHQ